MRSPLLGIVGGFIFDYLNDDFLGFLMHGIKRFRQISYLSNVLALSII